MTKILLPTDFSSDAANALDYALKLFGDQAVEYTLLNAYSYRMVSMDTPQTEEGGEIYELKQALAKIASDIRESNPTKSYSISERLEQGSLSTALEKIGESEEFDYVVMGTKGETADRGLFIGSVAKKTVQDSPFPVILVPSVARFNPISQLVYCTDLEHPEKKQLNQTITFSLSQNAALTLLFVDTDLSTEIVSTDELDKLIEHATVPISTKVLLSSEPGDAISNYAHENKVDMLVLTTNTTTFLQKLLHHSVTEEILMKTDIPLLVFNRETKSGLFG